MATLKDSSAKKPASASKAGERAKTSPKPVPETMHTVTPHLICAGAADAIDFYKKAFDATELMRLPGEGGKLMHACIRIGDSAVMLADEMAPCTEGPKSLKGSPVVLHLYVDDADAVAKRAEKAGAKIIMPVTDMFWGDRYGQIEDPFGHRWAIATHVRDLSADEIREGAKRAMQDMHK